MGITREQFVPAEPPPPGRYVVWEKGDELHEWRSAFIDKDGDWETDDDYHAPLRRVHWFMDVGGIS